MAKEDSKGMEALDGGKGKEEKKPESKGKGGKKAKGKKDAPRRIVTTRLDDGTYHHKHEYDGKDGQPDWGRQPEYSSADAEDAGDHVAQHMGADQGDDGEEAEEAQEQTQQDGGNEAAMEAPAEQE